MSPRGKSNQNRIDEKKRQSGQRANFSGHSAEEQIQKLFPYWQRIKEKPGHDFVAYLRDEKGNIIKPWFIEVKSSFPKQRIGRIEKPTLQLKVLHGEWMNQVADEVVILTRDMVYFAPAKDLHEFVRAHIEDYPINRKQGNYQRIQIPIDDLVQLNVISGVKRSRILNRIAQNVRIIKPKKKPAPKRNYKILEKSPLPFKPKSVQKLPGQTTFGRKPFRIPPKAPIPKRRGR